MTEETKESIEEEKKESIINKILERIADHESRIKKLEKELW